MGDAPRHHDDVPHPSQRRRGNGFLRAKLRHAVLTRVADTLTLGVLGRRHHAQQRPAGLGWQYRHAAQLSLPPRADCGRRTA